LRNPFLNVKLFAGNVKTFAAVEEILMTDPAATVVILGAGHAGGACGIALREQGFAGPIKIFGEEAIPPYERPSLSKEYLTGAEPKPTFLKADWAALNISLHLGTSARSIDLKSRKLHLDDDRAIDWDRLVIATGGRPRLLPASTIPLGHPRLFTVRTAPDADAIRAVAPSSRHAVVVGGGVIGLEVAASLQKFNVSTTVIERTPHLMARNVPTEPANWLADLHRSHGTGLHIGANIERIVAKNEGLVVHLEDTATVEADFVIIGIGIVPNVDIALEAGLFTDDGILVRDDYTTADPAVLAIGDVARREEMPRNESWAHAQTSARAAARTIMGLPTEAHEPPWFWTDQFDHRLQIAGEVMMSDSVIFRSAAGGGRVALYLRGGRLHGVAAFNATRDFGAARRLVASRAALDPLRAADPSCDLRRAVA
jgi:3-phenylpropionate/trans-cinnamate dioxygenase ferredoxin reductase component